MADKGNRQYTALATATNRLLRAWEDELVARLSVGANHDSSENATQQAVDNFFIVLVTIRSGDPQNTTTMVTRSWLWRRLDDIALSRARMESLWVNDGEELDCRVWCGGRWWETEGQVDGKIRLQPV